MWGSWACGMPLFYDHTQQGEPVSAGPEARQQEGTLIELDGRRRASLGRIGRHSRYLAFEEGDGTLVLRPAVVMTEAEARLHANPALVEHMVEAITDPSKRVRGRGRPQRKD